jgi:two-component system OmpR family response regulator
MKHVEHIMVVEDDPDISDMLCQLLRSQGYDTECVFDGAKAVERVVEQRPEAIVLDVMLPGMNGFDVCRKLKFRKDTNQIPILMLTALNDPQSRRQGLRVGANRYLTKPFDPLDLLKELRDLLDNHRRLADGHARAQGELHMQSDSRYREHLNDLLDELFQLTPLSEADIGRMRYAVLEMTENAIEWGNGRNEDLTVTIAYEVSDDQMKFVITDQGPGFDRDDCPHAACEEDPVSHLDLREKLGLRQGGFGIMIAKGMVDKVEYNGAGNQVTLTKYFATLPSAAAQA